MSENVGQIQYLRFVDGDGLFAVCLRCCREELLWCLCVWCSHMLRAVESSPVWAGQHIQRHCGRADPAANLFVFKNVIAGQDETYADVNTSSSGAIEIRHRWLKGRAHKCLRTQYDDVSPLTSSLGVVEKSYTNIMSEHQLFREGVWKPRRPEIRKLLFCNGLRVRMSTTLCFVIVFRSEKLANPMFRNGF